MSEHEYYKKAKLVINLLMIDYANKFKKENYFDLRDYLNTIRYTIEDYEDDGMDFTEERKKYSILEKKLEGTRRQN